jgi:3-methyladenine DNA glycosylase AlkD
MRNIIDQIRSELLAVADPAVQASSQRYFKDPIKSYGVKGALVHKISRESFQQIKGKTKTEILELCEELWQSGYIEEAGIACLWTQYIYKQYEPEDFEVFERWIGRYVDNWATCDTLCNHPVGTLIEMYPHLLPRLKEFARSENRWMRRASAVSLIIPARKGLFLDDILEIADILLPDKEDMVQKGYGWMLKAASQAHQKEVFDYVMKHRSVMPRTALRYAIEKMPVEMRRAAMER